MLFESLLEIKETGEELNQQLVNNLCFYLDKTDFKPSWYVTVKCPRLYNKVGYSRCAPMYRKCRLLR